MQFCYISSEETLMSMTSKVCQRLTNSVVSEKHLFFISNSDARACVFRHCANHDVNLFLCIRINSQNPIQQYMGEEIQLSSEMLRRSFSKQFQPTAEIKHNNSSVTSHLLQQLINNHKLCSESHHNSPHFQPIFLVKLQGPPNLKPDITICV